MSSKSPFGGKGYKDWFLNDQSELVVSTEPSIQGLKMYAKTLSGKWLVEKTHER